MDSPLHPLTTDERKVLRKQVSEWARSEVSKSVQSRRQIQTALRQPDGWLNNRLSGVSVTFTLEQLRMFARVLRVPIPAEIEQTAARLEVASRSLPRPRQSVPRITADDLNQAGSAEAEMRLLLDAASYARKNRSRDREWTFRRFGLRNGRAETLEEIAAGAGFTRERVRQIEAKMLQLVSVVAAGHPLPILASIHQRVLESVGLPWDAVELELRPFLGDVPLREAVRFLEEVQPPAQKVGMDRASIYGLGNTLRVVATSHEDIRFTTQVSTAARKIFSFAGAVLVNDVRALLETTRKKPVSLRDLVRTLGVLPDLQWLDGRHRWCWFDTPELSGLLRRCAAILTAAKAPVDMETLYAGLVREARREHDSLASHVSDPLPPAHVVHAILKRHPQFRRAVANSFTYVGSQDAPLEFEPAVRVILERLDALGGAATRSELFELEHHPQHPIQRNSFAFYLYCCGCIERIGPGAWAIRGRPVDEERRREVLCNSGVRGGQVPRPSGPAWSVVLRLTEASRRNRMLAFPSASIPYQSAGPYLLPDGHECMLHQDRHGPRITRLGPQIKALLSNPAVPAIRFEFDSDARTVVAYPEPLDDPA